jgi:uncharacterized membrane protein
MPESALSTFIILVVIGIVVGLIFNRYGRTWMGRQVADVTGVGDVTYSLIGIAPSWVSMWASFWACCHLRCSISSPSSVLH